MNGHVSIGFVKFKNTYTNLDIRFTDFRQSDQYKSIDLYKPYIRIHISSHTQLSWSTAASNSTTISLSNPIAK